MRPIYNKWLNLPMMTSIKSTNYPIWNISFPAVTICSNNKIDVKQLDQVLEEEEPWKTLSSQDPNFKELLDAGLEAYIKMDSNHEVFKEDSLLYEYVAAFFRAYKNDIPHLIQKVT